MESLKHNLSCENTHTGTFRYIGNEDYFTINKSECLKFLKENASNSQITQSRICFHENDMSELHYMMVYHSKDHIVRKHMHTQKGEYLIIIGGSMTIKIYKEKHKLPTKIYTLKANTNGPENLFCYIPKNTIHDAIIHEDCFFIETTLGPFDRESTIYTKN